MKGGVRVMSDGRRHATGCGTPWTDAQEVELLRLRGIGHSVDEAAAQLGMKRQRVSDKLRQIGGRAGKTTSINRRCLSCRRTFPSEGVHERLCGACKRAA